MNIGFIGLGVMGTPMAKNLLKYGHTVYVNDINILSVKKLEENGAEPVGDLEEMASRAEVIITMLPSGRIVKDVLLDEERGIGRHLKKGHIVIDMSSLTAGDALEIDGALRRKGIIYADAPVSGGEPMAISGELSVMMGCDEEQFQKLKDIVHPMSKSVTRVGNVGAGSTVKLANQIIVNLNIVALSEAAVLARKMGIELETMFEAIRNGLAGSNVMEAKFPKMIAEDYTPGGTININYKDLYNVTSTGDAEGITLPVTNLVKEIYKSEIINGNGTNDHSGVIKYLERINNMQVKYNGDE